MITVCLKVVRDGGGVLAGVPQVRGVAGIHHIDPAGRQDAPWRARLNSRVVSGRGVSEPAKTSRMIRSRVCRGQAFGDLPGLPHAQPQQRGLGQIEPAADVLGELAVQLHHHLAGLRVGGVEVARQ